MLRLASLIPRSGILLAAALAFIGAQITASVAQQADQRQLGWPDRESVEPKTSVKRAQPGSASAAPENPETVASAESASKPASSLAEGPQSSSGMRLIRYGRPSRVYGVH